MSKQKRNQKSRPRGKNAFADSVLAIFTKQPYRAYNYKQVAASLGLKDKASKDLVNIILVELIEDGAIQELKPGKYRISPSYARETPQLKNYITGKVDMKGTGKAYITNDEGGEDIYIAPNNTSRALNGDRVKVLLFPKRKDHKTEGQIIEILERAKEQYVGIIDVSKHFAYLVADNINMPVDINRRNKHQVVNGVIVYVKKFFREGISFYFIIFKIKYSQRTDKDDGQRNRCYLEKSSFV